MKKPNLFIVGEAKTGTTAMFALLKQHPDVFMPRTKEPRHFCKDLIAESDRVHKKNHLNRLFKDTYLFRSREQYLSLFEEWRDEKVAGEASIQYFPSKVAASEIHEFNPDAKIVVMLREPVDFLYSLHSQMHFGGSEPIADFAEALEAEADRRQGRRIPKHRFVTPSLLFYSERVKYADGVRRYQELFGENVKVIMYDDFKKNNAKTYREILEFIGVDPSFTPEFRVYNPNKTARWRWLKQVMDSPLFEYMIRRPFRPLLPARMRPTIRKRILRLIMKHEPRKPLDAEFVLRLRKQFKQEVEKISVLLDRNLVKEWGYDRV